jgi:hypothetical protein
MTYINIFDEMSEEKMNPAGTDRSKSGHSKV